MRGFRITSVSAFVTVNPEDDEEGVIGFHGPLGWTPLVCADEARVESLRPIAQQIADMTGFTVQLKRFSVMEIVETLTPAPVDGKAT